jgi:hypothetical protein
LHGLPQLPIGWNDTIGHGGQGGINQSLTVCRTQSGNVIDLVDEDRVVRRSVRGDIRNSVNAGSMTPAPFCKFKCAPTCPNFSSTAFSRVT